jgi:hypothetical protein
MAYHIVDMALSNVTHSPPPPPRRYHSVAITSHGTMYTWGSGEHGQLCHGIDGECPTLVPSWGYILSYRADFLLRQRANERLRPGDEMIPRVVDSLLHRALLKVCSFPPPFRPGAAVRHRAPRATATRIAPPLGGGGGGGAPGGPKKN